MYPYTHLSYTGDYTKMPREYVVFILILRFKCIISNNFYNNHTHFTEETQKYKKGTPFIMMKKMPTEHDRPGPVMLSEVFYEYVFILCLL